MPDNGQTFLDSMNNEDREKLVVLTKSFATAEDLKRFIKMSQTVHNEQERRKWAWDIMKKTAAAIVLFAAAIAAVRNGMAGDWWGGGSR